MGAAQSQQVPMPPAAWALMTLWSTAWDAPRFRTGNAAFKSEEIGPLLKLAASCVAVLQEHVERDGPQALPPHGASRELLVSALDQTANGAALANPTSDPEGFVRTLAKACFKTGDNEFVEYLPEERLDTLLQEHCATILSHAALLKNDPSSALQSVLQTTVDKVQTLADMPLAQGDLEAVANRFLLASSLQRVAEEADSLLARPPCMSEENKQEEGLQRSEIAKENDGLKRTKSQMAASLKVQKVKQHVEEVASPVHELARSVSVLAKHDINDIDQTQVLRAELDAVDQARKRARNFGEDLVEDMLALDGLSNLTQEDRNMRKTSIQGIESLLQDVDAAKGRLGKLHESLKTKLSLVEAAQAQKGTQVTPVPSMLPQQDSATLPDANHGVKEVPPPTKKDWSRLRLRLPFHSREEPSAYQIAATVPGLSTEELKLELNEDKTKLTVRGLRVPTPDETTQLQQKISMRVAQLVRQSPEYVASLQGNVSQVTRDAYMELGQDSFGRFAETFLMPEDADIEGIDASYRDGVLRITVPKGNQVPRRPFGMAGLGGAGRFSGGRQRGQPSSARGRGSGALHCGRPSSGMPSQHQSRQGLFGGLDNSYFW